MGACPHIYSIGAGPIKILPHKFYANFLAILIGYSNFQPIGMLKIFIGLSPGRGVNFKDQLIFKKQL